MKYELLENDTITHCGHKLYRVKRLSDGELGGYIESEKNLSHEGTCFVDRWATVYENAYISGNAIVSSEASVHGNARVSGQARILGLARIYGDAEVTDLAQVYESAQVCGSAKIYGDCHIAGNVRLDKGMWNINRGI